MKFKESETVEFKKSLGQLDDALKSICSFLNHNGGILYFGIDDTGKSIGLQQISDTTIRNISQQICLRIKPETSPEVKELFEKKKLLVTVTVTEGMNKPYFLNGIAYKRVGTENRIIPPDELKKIILEQKQEKWDEKICEDTTMQDINEEAVKLFLRNANFERRLEISEETKPHEALKKLQLLIGTKYTNACILLFAKNPQHYFYQTEVRCARFKGLEPVNFIDMKVFGKTVIDQVEDALAFVKKNIQLAATIKGTERVETWEYPLEAIREAITNAICHRDYILNSNVQVRIFDDRVEVWSPGYLQKPLTIKDLKEKHESVLRNVLIGKCFFLIKFIEQWGTGTNRMITDCRKLGFPDPLFEEIAGNFVVTFKKTKFIESDIKNLNLNERQEKIFSYFKDKKEITRAGYALFVGCSIRTAYTDLQELVEKQVLKRVSKGKHTYYTQA